MRAVPLLPQSLPQPAAPPSSLHTRGCSPPRRGRPAAASSPDGIFHGPMVAPRASGCRDIQALLPNPKLQRSLAWAGHAWRQHLCPWAASHPTGMSPAALWGPPHPTHGVQAPRAPSHSWWAPSAPCRTWGSSVPPALHPIRVWIPEEGAASGDASPERAQPGSLGSCSLMPGSLGPGSLGPRSEGCWEGISGAALRAFSSAGAFFSPPAPN